MNTARLRELLRQGVAPGLMHSACCPQKGGKGSSPPPAPDYTGAAREQAAASQETTLQQTYANRPSQQTPWGQTNWQTSAQIDPATGKQVTAWTQRETLDPKLQAALDQQLAVQSGRSQLAQGFMGRVSDAYAQPFNYGGMAQGGQSINAGALPQAPGSIDQATQQAYQRMQQLAAPEQQRAQAALQSRMSAMGVPMTSEAYGTQQQRFGDQINRQNLAMQQQAMQEGRSDAQMQQQLRDAALREQMNIGGYQDTLRQRQIAEEAQRRGMSLNEMNALLTGQQVQSPQMPSFMGASQAQAPNLLGAAQSAGNYNMNAWQQQQQSQGNAMGDIASLAGTAAMFAFSDARLKSNIVRVGRHPIGVDICEYDIGGRRERGVVAQELQAIAPHLVKRHSSGYLMVNYGGL